MRIRDILFPTNDRGRTDPEHQWETDELDNIAEVLNNVGVVPPDYEDYDYDRDPNYAEMVACPIDGNERYSDPACELCKGNGEVPGVVAKEYRRAHP